MPTSVVLLWLVTVQLTQLRKTSGEMHLVCLFVIQYNAVKLRSLLLLVYVATCD